MPGFKVSCGYTCSSWECFWFHVSVLWLEVWGWDICGFQFHAIVLRVVSMHAPNSIAWTLMASL